MHLSQNKSSKNMNQRTKHYVTHIITPELPEKGYDQVFFYTATAESYDKGIYYWGTDNNSFDQEFIEGMIKREKIFRLEATPYPMGLSEDETIWVDHIGNLYVADIHEPTKNQKKLRPQSFLEKLIAKTLYRKSTEMIDLPQISKYIKVAELS
jgi:hypothetical protein